MEKTLKIVLKSGKDEAVKRYHPWIFSGAIKKIFGAAYDGCRAEVFSNKDEYLGCGIYQDATIAVRILAFAPYNPESFGADFWLGKLEKAYYLRKDAGLINSDSTNVYRLVHGEGDHLPGLIIDHYNGVLVIQIHSTGLYPYLDHIANALKALYGSRLKAIFDKSKDTLPAAFWEKGEPRGFLTGHENPVEVMENGYRFLVDVETGQKTGFFIDQRDNRKLLGQYAAGRKVLNTFCYSGGFSIYALGSGATQVHSLDSSARAMDLVEKNLRLNSSHQENHRSITSDAIQYLKQSSQESYDLIILDPPAYAKHQNVKHKAIQGYKRLNLEAIKAIGSPGILFTFSCSQVIDLSTFRSTVMAAAVLSGREARILHQLTQPPDHPVNLFHPEGQYLKGLVVRID